MVDTKLEFRCDYCRRPLSNPPLEPYRIEQMFGGTLAYHEGCREIATMYEHMKAMHEHSCHLPNCDKGPKNPFSS